MRFWDSSALIPLCLDQPQTERARTLHGQDPDLVVWWGSPDTLDPLNREVIADSRTIGSAVALSPVVGGRVLTFEPAGEDFVDRETGSTWTIVGRAVAGPLAGTQLEVLSHRNEFWFAWTAFFGGDDVFEG